MTEPILYIELNKRLDLLYLCICKRLHNDVIFHMCINFSMHSLHYYWVVCVRVFVCNVIFETFLMKWQCVRKKKKQANIKAKQLPTHESCTYLCFFCGVLKFLWYYTFALLIDCWCYKYIFLVHYLANSILLS